MDRLGSLVVIAPARRAGEPGSNPGSGENFSLKLLIYIHLGMNIKNRKRKRTLLPKK